MKSNRALHATAITLAAIVAACGGGNDSNPDAALGPDASATLLTVREASGTSLGTLVGMDAYGLTVHSPAGYYYWVSWAGTFINTFALIGYNCNARLNFSSAGCDCASAHIYLDDECTDTGVALNGRYLTYPSHCQGFYKFTTLDGNGNAVGAPFTAASAWSNGTCDPAGGNAGWELTAITRAEAGIPAAIQPPLSIR